jgi:hypothetical protein
MYTGSFPKQKIPYRKKTIDWRKTNVDWGDRRSVIYDNTVRKNFYNKKIDYDLYNGRVHKEDMKLVLNPNGITTQYVPDNIQHYPILINPINVLVGEEAKRRFDFKVIVTNPNAISQKERTKLKEINQKIQEMVTDTSTSEEEIQEKMKEFSDYMTFEWQDLREMRGNELLNHYIKELDVKLKFNQGFKDALIAAEELYQCDIVQGEPIFEKLNPRKVFAIRSGYSNRIEDSDIIIVQDYWNPGKIIDFYYDELSPKDVETIESFNLQISSSDQMDNIDERDSFINRAAVDENGTIIDDFIFTAFANGYTSNGYYDNQGNIRVLKVYWKSKRKIQKVKKYDENGEQYFEYHDENYKPNKDLGEEATTYWINEAWEGTKIGKDIYVNMRPRPVQYNRISNPSRCHFGIIGSVHNTNQSRGVSLVDRMKPYQYLYDAVKNRLNSAIARNMGKILELDLAKVPAGWDINKWLYYMKQDGIAVIDSFKEGNKGMATGKLAGGFNTTGGAIDLETGNYIQQHIALLEYIQNELNLISGVSPQRQGQIQNRETVGGIERAVQQSSSITEEYYTIHDNTKKRALECLLETAKIAMHGKSKKFQYINSDYSLKLVDIEGDEFAEADYGILVDNDSSNLVLEQNLQQLAHAALQNQMLSFSTIMDIFTTQSLSSIRRRIEKDEQDAIQRKNEEMKQQQQSAERIAQMNRQQELDKLDLERENNIRDNEYDLKIAMLKQEGNDTTDLENNSMIELQKLQLEREKIEKEFQIKKEQLQIDKTKNNNKS